MKTFGREIRIMKRWLLVLLVSIYTLRPLLATMSEADAAYYRSMLAEP